MTCQFALLMELYIKEAFQEKDCATAKENRFGMTVVYMRAIGQMATYEDGVGWSMQTEMFMRESGHKIWQMALAAIIT